MEIEEVLKNALQARVRQVPPNSNVVLDFENGQLSQHLANNEQAHVVVSDATNSAANQFNRVLNSDGRQIIRDSISIETGYGDVVDVMDDALSNGTNPRDNIG